MYTKVPLLRPYGIEMGEPIKPSNFNPKTSHSIVFFVSLYQLAINHFLLFPRVILLGTFHGETEIII